MTKDPFDLYAHLDTLRGLWEYGALGLYTKNEGKKCPQEYEARLFKIWDELDKLDMDTVENIIMELEGRLLGDSWDTTDKILKSQLEYYHKVRVEQEDDNQV